VREKAAKGFGVLPVLRGQTAQGGRRLKSCPKCGKELPDEYEFCNKCGFRLEKDKPSSGTAPQILVDGSNVLYAGGPKPVVKNLQLVLQKLKEEKYQHITFVDASMKHRVDDKLAFESMISQGTVKQVPANTPADRWFLEYAARHPEYKILSNDRFADWKEGFPWVGEQDRFIRFMVVNGEVLLKTPLERRVTSKASVPSRPAPVTPPKPDKKGVPKTDSRPPQPPAPPKGAARKGSPKKAVHKSTTGREVLAKTLKKPDAPTQKGRDSLGGGVGIKEPKRVATPSVVKIRQKSHGARFTWASFIVGIENALVFLGLAILLYGFANAYGLMGTNPDLGVLGVIAISITLGMSFAMLTLRRADAKVRAVGGNVLAATGLGLLIYCLLTTYGLMGAAPQLGNAPWLAIMMGIGLSITVAGIKLIRELEANDREVWGNVFAVAGFVALGFSAIAVHGLVGRAPQLGNLTWLAVMLAISGFLMSRGWAMALEHKGRTLLAWGGVLLGSAVLVALYCLYRANNLQGRLAEVANWFWLAMLIPIFLLLLLQGFKLVHKWKLKLTTRNIFALRFWFHPQKIVR
jgi:hypothetical protein